jgi:hypothetical protein
MDYRKIIETIERHVDNDPNKPLRDAHATIRQLNDRIKTLENQVDTLAVESRVYRRLVRDILNLKD